MKAKVYIPIIIGAGAAAGIILGVVNFGSHKPENDQDHSVIAQETTTSETTLSEEEKKKLEEQKNKEYEEKKKKEEQNASDKLKKKDEEKQKKKEEEAKKKEEEEKKKEEEEKRKAEEEKASEESREGTEEELQTEKSDSDDGYEYIYVPVNNNSNNYGQQYSDSGYQTEPAPAQTQHLHTWEQVYRTVHHNATTHNEKQRVGTTEYQECFYNGSLYFTLITEYDGTYFYQVCRLANGDLFHETAMESEKIDINDVMKRMRISAEDEAYTFTNRIEEITNDVTVTDKEAYDEKVFDHWVCTGCGQTG